MELEKLSAIIESLLFTSGEPVAISRLVKITGASKPEVENALMVLDGEYAKRRGLAIIKNREAVELVTNPDNAAYIAELVKSEIQERLSQASLEVLSITAYRGPVTRAEIEAIRGVNSSFSLRTLLMRGLVEREDNPKDGRGYRYMIASEFLKRLGVTKTEELPDWEVLSKEERISSILGETMSENQEKK